MWSVSGQFLGSEGDLDHHLYCLFVVSEDHVQEVRFAESLATAPDQKLDEQVGFEAGWSEICLVEAHPRWVFLLALHQSL